VSLSRSASVSVLVAAGAAAVLERLDAPLRSFVRDAWASHHCRLPIPYLRSLFATMVCDVLRCAASLRLDG
jgi:hypothetical protein